MSSEVWEAIGAVGQWAGAAASTAAVIVALRLARRGWTMSLSVSARYVHADDIRPDIDAFRFIYPDAAVAVHLVNNGAIPVRPRRFSVLARPGEQMSELLDHYPVVLPVVDVGGGVVVYLRQLEVLARSAINGMEGGHVVLVVEDTAGRRHIANLPLPDHLPLPGQPGVGTPP